jgi:hypothetical protein
LGAADASTAALKVVDYDYRDLHTWYKRIMENVARVDGVVTMSISSRLNRIRLGVDDRTKIESVTEALEQAGVPRAAVNVEFRPGRIQLLTDLDDKVRPTIAGLGIGIVGESHCTLGYNLDLTGTNDWFFVTASHCSFVATLDTFDMGQPYLSGANEIGGEVSDPSTFEHSDDSWCPDGSPSPQCRYSDASLYEYTGPDSDWVHGYVAWPNVSSTSYSVERQIVGKGDPLEGHTLHKVGKESGRSYGLVDEECESTYVPANGFWVLCYLVIDDNSAKPGDSGGPVLYAFGSDALAAGVLFGRDTTAGTMAASNIYSVFYEIENDIGGTLCVNIGCSPDPTVLIQGPSVVPPYVQCEWTTVTLGGVAPYSFQWSGVLSGTGSSIQDDLSSSGTLTVTVTDDVNHTDVSHFYVTVDEEATGEGCVE